VEAKAFLKLRRERMNMVKDAKKLQGKTPDAVGAGA
jgi:hypothetical protein